MVKTLYAKSHKERNHLPLLFIPLIVLFILVIAVYVSAWYIVVLVLTAVLNRLNINMSTQETFLFLAALRALLLNYNFTSSERK